MLKKGEDAPGTVTNVPGAILLAVAPSGETWLRYDDPATRVRYNWRGRTADPLALDFVASFETLEDGPPEAVASGPGYLSIVKNGETLVVGRDVRGPRVPGRGSIYPLIPVLSGGMLLPDPTVLLPLHVECEVEEAIAPVDLDGSSLAPFDVLELTHELAPREQVTVRVTAQGVFVVLTASYPGFASRERLQPIAGPEIKPLLDDLVRASGAPFFVPPPQQVFPPEASLLSLVVVQGHRRFDLVVDKIRARTLSRWAPLIHALEGLTEAPSRRAFPQ